MTHLKIAIFVSLLFGGSVFAQGDGGTTSPFAFGAGARDLSLGGADMAGSDATTAPFWNPARLVDAQYVALSGFHCSLYESDVAYQYLGIVMPTLDFGTFGMGVFRLGVSGIEKRDAGNVLLGEIDDSRLAIYLAYGRQMSGIDFGIAATLEHHSLDSYKSTSSPGINLAASRRYEPALGFVDHVTIAAMGRNIVSPSMDLVAESVQQPFGFETGITVGLIPKSDWDQQVTLSARLLKSESIDPRLAVGLEYSFNRLLQLRAGIRESKASFGVGLEYRALNFDYALVDRDLGSLHMFTLTTSFGQSVNDRRVERDTQRENDFNSLMQDRLTDRNRETVTQMAQDGERLLGEGDLLEAANSLDRALFLARANEMDTLHIHDLLAETNDRLEEVRKKVRFSDNLATARSHLKSDDFLTAAHFARLALEDSPNSPEATLVLETAEAAADETEARDQMIETRLAEVDSLLSYGFVDEALAAVRTLRDYADNSASIRLAIKRVEFEHWREVASAALDRNDLTAAMTALDTALTLFPNHRGLKDVRARVAADLRQPVAEVAPVIAPEPEPLSASMVREIEATGKIAQEAFEKGDLERAIANWEKVERLAPDYQNVRTYLVNAYKYVGIEQYGQNQLHEAVATWGKAAALDPDNAEIADYLKRTKNEIVKLRELTYEQ